MSPQIVSIYVVHHNNSNHQASGGYWINLKAHISTLEIDEPKSVREALHGLDLEKWMVAMQEELDSICANQVWDLVDLPQD